MKLLLNIKKYAKFESLLISVGSGSLRWFENMVRFCKLLMFPIVGGILPDRELLDKLISSKFLIVRISRGMKPERLLSLSLKLFMLINFPISTGIGPDMLFRERDRNFRFSDFPISLGIWPKIRLFAKFRYNNLAKFSIENWKKN